MGALLTLFGCGLKLPTSQFGAQCASDEDCADDDDETNNSFICDVTRSVCVPASLGARDGGASPNDGGDAGRDAGSDGGTGSDSGTDSDGGFGLDSGILMDAGPTLDAGQTTMDAGVPSDAGTAGHDAGITMDGGLPFADAGDAPDGGTPSLDGGAIDAGATDAGHLTMDGGLSIDGGLGGDGGHVDAGAPNNDGGPALDSGVHVDSGLHDAGVTDAGVAPMPPQESLLLWLDAVEPERSTFFDVDGGNGQGVSVWANRMGDHFITTQGYSTPTTTELGVPIDGGEAWPMHQTYPEGGSGIAFPQGGYFEIRTASGPLSFGEVLEDAAQNKGLTIFIVLKLDTLHDTTNNYAPWAFHAGDVAYPEIELCEDDACRLRDYLANTTLLNSDPIPTSTLLQWHLYEATIYPYNNPEPYATERAVNGDGIGGEPFTDLSFMDSALLGVSCNDPSTVPCGTWFRHGMIGEILLYEVSPLDAPDLLCDVHTYIYDKWNIHGMTLCLP